MSTLPSMASLTRPATSTRPSTRSATTSGWRCTCCCFVSCCRRFGVHASAGYRCLPLPRGCGCAASQPSLAAPGACAQQRLTTLLRPARPCRNQCYTCWPGQGCTPLTEYRRCGHLLPVPWVAVSLLGPLSAGDVWCPRPLAGPASMFSTEAVGMQGGLLAGRARQSSSSSWPGATPTCMEPPLAVWRVLLPLPRMPPHSHLTPPTTHVHAQAGRGGARAREGRRGDEG